jgi:pimeloyl-ACP methyl ester carboxylesterase
MTEPTVETRTIPAPGGRTLTLELGGDPNGAPILAHNGTPNSRHLYGGCLEDAARQRILLIGYDRPGYGGSTAQPGRTVADCADDVRAIAAALGIRRLAVWGYSGGGPHALACAALLPDLVAAVSALASPAPYGAEGLDYFAGMGSGNVEDIQLYFTDPATARRKRAKTDSTC